MPRNPVWQGYLADPYVLRVGDRYYAYGTAEPDSNADEVRHFPVLVSDDLHRWRHLGAALAAPEGHEKDSFWAPEVVFRDGVYYMYYSSGGVEGEAHQIRLAVSEAPAGPFVGDARTLLPEEPFSIDAHPFWDPMTDRWYLFFGKDFFGERAGTGIAAVELEEDMRTLASGVQTILEPSADWQIYERNRDWYGKTWPAWHTVEGPFVVHRRGRYWLFYSGGLWKGADYGVSFAVADSVLGPYLEPHPNGAPKLVLAGNGFHGAGHNSVFLGSDGDYIAYHAWDAEFTARRMFIDRLEWGADGPAIVPVESFERGQPHDQGKSGAGT